MQYSGPPLLQFNGRFVNRAFYIDGIDDDSEELNNGIISGKIFLNKFGLLHRLDGPAYISKYGSQCWLQNGLYHRLDGPAFVGHNGHLEWFKDDKHHRIDGPAMIAPWLQESWAINGKYLSAKEIKQWCIETEINPDWKEWEQQDTILFALKFS